MTLRWRDLFIATTLAAASVPAAQAIDIPGVGNEAQGADVVILQLDPDSRPDIILMGYDNPAGTNNFRYRVGRNLDAAGVTTDWSTNYVQVAGFGPESQGAGAAVAYLDSNAAPELILMAYDNPVGANGFRYKIGWNLNQFGVTSTWTNHAPVAGLGTEGQGAAVVVGQIDGNLRPDMLFIAYDNPAGPNSFRYRIGRNINAAGNAIWSTNVVQVAGVGAEGQGMGATLTDINGNNRPDLIFLANDNPAGVNIFRYRQGLDVTTLGTATWPAGSLSRVGVGAEAQGAGIAVACLDADPRGDVILMSNDNPAGANIFRYQVVANQVPGRCAFGPNVRKSIDDLTPPELASLRRGVRQMMQWNNSPRTSPEFRRSWLYWSNIHAYFGSACPGHQGPIPTAGMAGVTLQSAQPGVEAATWCTCKHTSPQFLTWHRMYLYYFERVLQAAAHDTSLRLPFWDIGVDGKIPPAFRNPTYVDETGATVANPLYVAQRQASLNSGGALSPTITDPSGAMQAVSYTGFNSSIEGLPHNPVHCATGVSGCGSGRMGHSGSAGLDPIFYVHHANIDRLYECWLAQNEPVRLPPVSLRNISYHFSNEQGVQQTRTVATMMTLAQLGFQYGSGTGCPTVVGTTGDHNIRLRMIPLAGPTRLDRVRSVVPLRLEPDSREQARADGAGRAHAVVVLEGLTFDRRPGALFHVFLQGPDGRRSLLGVIDFFSRPGAGEEHRHSGGEPPSPVMLANPVPPGLLAGGGEGWSLVFEPTTGLADSTVEKAAQLIPPDANVRFEAARIRLESVVRSGRETRR